MKRFKFLLIFPLFFISSFCSAALELHENYLNDYCDEARGTCNLYWSAQSFHATSTYTLDTISIQLANAGNFNGIVKLWLYNSSSDLPTTNFCGDPIEISYTTFTNSLAWYDIDVSSWSCELTDNTEYAIVIGSTGDETCSDNDYFFTYWDYGYGGVFTDGKLAWYNSGWSDGGYPDNDICFKNYSETVIPPETTSDLDYNLVLAIILLGIFLVILIDLLRRMALGI